MTLPEAMAAHAPWLNIWINVLMLGLFVAPAVMLFWPDSRKLGAAGLIAGIAGAIAIDMMFKSAGYTRMLGFGHVLFLTPFAFVMWQTMRHADLRAWPRRIIWFSFTVACISLAFDYVDVLRYIFGERGVIAG